MRKLLLVASFIFITSGYLLAQSDSLIFVKAKWERTRIGKGVILKQYAFPGNLFSSNQFISILEIKANKRNIFDLAYEPQVLRYTSDFGKSAGALAALNGSFFDVKNGGSVDYLRADGKVVTENKLAANGSRIFHQKAAVMIDSGKLGVASWDGSADWENTLQAQDVLLTGPMLIHQNQNTVLDTSAFVRLRHPRSAVAVAGAKVFLIAVDGRDENAAGLNLYELQKIVRWLKSASAVNLDGGGSTTLWINSKNKTGIVNHPCDDKKWDAEGERKVANAIILRRN